jgi:hypothetical protein
MRNGKPWLRTSILHWRRNSFPMPEAYIATPSHLALPWPMTLPYQIMGSVVHYSKMEPLMAATGQNR